MSGGDAADEPGPFHCHECDARTWNEPDMHAYCDACRTDHLEAARATAHAAGAEAERAAIVAAIRRFADKYDGRGLTGTARKNVEMLADLIKQGAHVGAAKKGGG